MKEICGIVNIDIDINFNEKWCMKKKQIVLSLVFVSLSSFCLGSSSFYYKNTQGQASPTSIVDITCLREDERAERELLTIWASKKSSTGKPFFTKKVQFQVRDEYVSLCRIKAVPSSFNRPVSRFDKVSS